MGRTLSVRKTHRRSCAKCACAITVSGGQGTKVFCTRRCNLTFECPGDVLHSRIIYEMYMCLGRLSLTGGPCAGQDLGQPVHQEDPVRVRREHRGQHPVLSCPDEMISPVLSCTSSLWLRERCVAPFLSPAPPPPPPSCLSGLALPSLAGLDGPQGKGGVLATKPQWTRMVKMVF